MEIYRFLADKKSATVSEVVEYVGLTQPTVSYHLGEMKKNGILTSKKDGKEVFYSLREKCPHFDAYCVLQSVEFPGESAKSEVYEQ